MSGCIVLAAGGTGGHMFPALAVAEALERRGRRVVLVTDGRGVRYVEAGRARRVIAAASPSGGLLAIARGLVLLGLGAVQSLRVLGELRPTAAALFGGYAAIPAALAAALRRTPLLVHEQNAVFGRANRLAARLARRIALSFEATGSVPAGLEGRCTVTGNPVRPGFAAGIAAAAPVPDRLRILVLGGSQGARVFADLLPAAVAALPPALRARLDLAQQCRPEDLGRVREAYAAIPLAAELSPFFTDVPARMAAADLVVARAGASTVAELLMLARPSLLVPYPHAADDHQTANARSLEQAGAALLMPQADATAASLALHLARLQGEPGRLAAMTAAARRLARPAAADTLAEAIVALEGDAP